VKYVLIAVTVFLIVVAGMLAVKGLLNKDSLLQLIGKRPAPEPVEAEEVVVPTLGGSIGDKLAAREKELDAREQRLNEQAARIKQERSELDKLVDEVDAKLKELRGEIDAREAENAKRLKDFAEKIAGMKPDKAASLLEELDTEDAIKVLEYIEPRQSAKIFDNMETGANEITRRIVGGT